MREIEFRGKSVYNNNWIYGFFAYNPSNSAPSIYTHGGVNKVCESTVGRYIGKKDENGTKIFEGDILESFIHPKIHLLHVVEWSDKYMGWFMRAVGSEPEDNGCVQAFVYFRNTKSCKIIGSFRECKEEK